MRTVDISTIAISDEGSLLIQPADHADAKARLYPYIYRAATEVRWNEDQAAFSSPTPKKWSYGQWFLHILSSVKSELGVALVLTDRTAWCNVPPEIRTLIQAKFQNVA